MNRQSCETKSGHASEIGDRMISGIVLAGGSSARMGFPKALLKINGKTFLEQIVSVLHSARVMDIVIVLGAEEERIRDEMKWFAGRIIVNPEWETGQLYSLRAGLNALGGKEIHGALICPVDHPLISQSIIVDLLQAFWKSGKSIIIPTYEDRRGHPVIFAKTWFEHLNAAPSDEGARAIVRAHPEAVCEVPTNERGVVLNIDTNDDYENFIALKRE